MKHTIGIADLKISSNPEDVLITFALGSCLGITIYDPVLKVGGLLHAMLPQSSVDPKKAELNPFMFIDTGVPRLFRDCYKLGADKKRLIVKVAGGASFVNENNSDHFEIGKRNILMLRKLLWKNNVLLKSSEVGGAVSRTMSLDIDTGEVRLRVNGEETIL